MTTQPPLEIVVPTPTGTLNLQIEFGGSIVVIGANGSGKTRLGVHIEDVLAAKDIVQRIAAQKTLALDDVQLIGLELAETNLLQDLTTRLLSTSGGQKLRDALVSAMPKITP